MDVLYMLVSFFSSIVGAISGIGGGVIIKPVLDSISPFSVATISFLSGNTVLAMSVATLIRSRKSAVSINKRTSSLMAFGGILGGIGGKYIFDLVRKGFGNDSIIGISQSSMLILLCIGVIIFTLYKKRITPLHQNGSIFSIAIGILLGGIASFLGIGGGPINLAVLYLFFSMEAKTAALNSIFIIFFSQLANLLFSIAGDKIPDFNPVILLLMIGGGIIGGITGAHISHRMNHNQVDKLFIVVLSGIILLCGYNLFGWIL